MSDPDEDYCLTLDQKSIAVLISLRGKFVTPEDVLSVKGNISYEQSVEIAKKCNELICQARRYMMSLI